MVKKAASGSKKGSLKGGSRTLKIAIISIPVVIILLFLVLLLAVGPHKARSGFKTLSSMSLYAKLVDESKAPMENNNPVKPEYPTFFSSIKHGFLKSRFKKLKSLLGLKVEPWTASTYQVYIENLAKGRKEKGVTGNPVHKVVLTPTSKIVVWGDLQGSFHSLVRDLEHLASIGIIGDDLKLKSNDDYLVFLGDAVSRSAFSMETLTVIGSIMAQNPFNIFYIRGNHESNNYWHSYGFKDELQAKASHLSKETIPLEGITNEFFATLPVAVYFGMPPEVNSSFLRICHESISEANRVAKIDEPKLAKFLTTAGEKKLTNINLEQLAQEGAGGLFSVKACIKSEIKRDSYQAMDGMRQTLPENGAATWTMLSCPSETYQKGLSFFFDCFAIVSPGATFDQWTIELHKQDARTKDGFKTRKNYLLSGQEASGQNTAPAAQPTNPQPTATQTPLAPAQAPATAAPAPVAQQPQQATQVQPTPAQASQPQTQPMTMAPAAQPISAQAVAPQPTATQAPASTGPTTIATAPAAQAPNPSMAKQVQATGPIPAQTQQTTPVATAPTMAQPAPVAQPVPAQAQQPAPQAPAVQQSATTPQVVTPPAAQAPVAVPAQQAAQPAPAQNPGTPAPATNYAPMQAMA